MSMQMALCICLQFGDFVHLPFVHGSSNSFSSAV